MTNKKEKDDRIARMRALLEELTLARKLRADLAKITDDILAALPALLDELEAERAQIDVEIAQLRADLAKITDERNAYRSALAEAIPPGSCVVRVDDLDIARSLAGLADEHDRVDAGYTFEVWDRLWKAAREVDNGK